MKSTKANSSSTIYTEHMVDGALPSCAVTGTERGWGRLSRLGPGRGVGVCAAVPPALETALSDEERKAEEQERRSLPA